MRRAAALLLTLYAVALCLAALPAEVRPRALEAAGERARATLRAVGIRPGVAVFESSTRPSERIVLNDCIELRVRYARGAVRVVAPPDGRCVTRGVRVAAPWMEGLLRSVVLRAPPGFAEAALGDWVCHAPRFAALTPREVEIDWQAAWRDRTTGAEGLAQNAFVRWRCAPPGLALRVLGPRDGEP